MRASSLVLCLLAAIGCADRTGLLVEVTSSDLSVPVDLDGLRFEAESTTGRRVDETHALSGTWPYSLTVVPRDDDDLRATITLRVTGLRAGDEVIRRVVHGVRFEDGETRRVTIELSRSCLEVDCGRDVDCVAGMCVGADVDGGTDAGPPPDAGLDGGTDAGTEPDAGVDAGVDAGLDGGTDAGASSATLVISEVATGGATASDEFVELYNATDSPIDIAGLLLQYNPASGSGWTTRTTLPTVATIPARGFYLLAGASYSRGVTPDYPGAWPTGVLAGAGGHVRIVRDDVELDRFGWGTATMPEGSAAPRIASEATETYERKAVATSTAATMAGSDASRGNGWDTDDNASDFVHRTGADPQSTASAPEAP